MSITTVATRISCRILKKTNCFICFTELVPEKIRRYPVIFAFIDGVIYAEYTCHRCCHISWVFTRAADPMMIRKLAVQMSKEYVPTKMELSLFFEELHSISPILFETACRNRCPSCYEKVVEKTAVKCKHCFYKYCNSRCRAINHRFHARFLCNKPFFI